MISVVIMTWNRAGQRATNLLSSLLLHQEEPVSEVVLVDTSNDPDVAQDIVLRTREFDRCKLVQMPRDNLYKSWAFNIGIKAAQSEYIATTDIDFMFGADMVKHLKRRMGRNKLVLAEPMRLPKDADVADPFAKGRFSKLCREGRWWGKTGGPGTLQCAHHDWWFKVHGYDERYAEGLGGMDDDVIRRAKRDGMKIGRLPFEECRALHQWHPVSELKDYLSGVDFAKGDVVVNPDGWGKA